MTILILQLGSKLRVHAIHIPVTKIYRQTYGQRTNERTKDPKNERIDKRTNV